MSTSSKLSPQATNQLLAEAITEARRRLAALEAPPYWSPNPGPQTQALESEADELFYGGAAGGGKSFLLLGLAGTRHKRSLILRRELNQVRALEEDSKNIFGSTGATLNQSLHTWRNIPGGRMLELGGMENPDDYKKYQGHPHDLKGYDEITHFLRKQYVISKAWNRTNIKGQRVRTVCTGNPPIDADGAWVIDYWGPWLDPTYPHPAEPGELRWFIEGESDKSIEVPGPQPYQHKGRMIKPRSRTFIPARIEDNPIYMATGYDAVLDSLPDGLREMFREGNFHVQVVDGPTQVIPTTWVLAAQQRWRERIQPPGLTMLGLGADVARGGKDENVVSRLYGNWFAPLERLPGGDTPDGDTSAAFILKHLEGNPNIAVDVVGIGSSVFDSLKRQFVKRLMGFNGGSGSDAKTADLHFYFANLRAESWWRLREALDPASGMEIALPPDRVLLADLCAPRFILRGDTYLIEAKDDIKKRIQRSPDSGDAVVMAWYVAHYFKSHGGIHV